MNSRLFRILFLGFLCLWLGIIVPSHERGQIVLPGTPRNSAIKSCCALRGGTLSKLDFDNPSSEKKRPSREDRKRCALCQLIATLQVAHPPLLTLLPMGLLAITPPQRSLGITHCAYTSPVMGRAPPVG
ncbi:MAG: hypothetical protein JKX85_03995 [Phycisphaeraceae bacterium]|nr:hypothetical protein [Phycisphaeraceae bacterium]